MYMCLCSGICAHVYVYAYMYVFVCMHAYVYICICVYVCVYIYTVVNTSRSIRLILLYNKIIIDLQHRLYILLQFYLV